MAKKINIYKHIIFLTVGALMVLGVMIGKNSLKFSGSVDPDRLQ